VYRAANTKQAASADALTQLLLEDIMTMVALKQPVEIVIASHSDCGAAAAVGLSEEQVQYAHISWGDKIEELFPDIKVTVLHEDHSSCGEYHYGHSALK
jgi:carbonic anhydrase